VRTSTLIATGALRDLLKVEPSRRFPLRLLDARAGAAGRRAYLQAHLPGALHVDLDTDLAAIGDPAVGGRHPLPAPEAFAATLARLGITPEHQVVVYDDAAGANAAARLWWMLRAIGHRHAAVLDGGLAAAVEAGIALQSGEEPSPPPVPRIPSTSWSWPLAAAAEVATAAADPRALVLDVRSGERYRGETEPFDPVAGHIPGAANLPFVENLGPDGRFLPADTLRSLYARRFGDRLERGIVHCGSGVTACHTVLALEHAGLPRPALYVGSWGEWCRSDRRIATGVEDDA
jgi:thiosulfate/3-mercaptopyruvate sulfurtransferase